jgi:Cu+-exporting ATPase
MEDGKKSSTSLALSVFWGVSGSAVLLIIYFAVLNFVSGWEYTLQQLADFWYYIVSLAAGFGIQIGLYVHLRQSVARQHAGGRIVAVSGTTSTVAMVSCCTHYLVNLLPVLGATGFVALAAQYQVSLFWVGILANAIGIAYIGSRFMNFKREYA